MFSDKVPAVSKNSDDEQNIWELAAAGGSFHRAEGYRDGPRRGQVRNEDHLLVGGESIRVIGGMSIEGVDEIHGLSHRVDEEERKDEKVRMAMSRRSRWTKRERDKEEEKTKTQKAKETSLKWKQLNRNKLFWMRKSEEEANEETHFQKNCQTMGMIF